MEIIKSHMISNGVIWHEIELDWLILKVVYKSEGKYLLL